MFVVRAKLSTCSGFFMGEIKMKDRVYSNGDNNFMSLEDINHYFLEMGYPEGQEMIVESAEPAPRNHADYINSWGIIERANEAAFDDLGEITESYLSDVEDIDIEDLNKLIVNFLNERAGGTYFFGVKNIKREIIVLS